MAILGVSCGQDFAGGFRPHRIGSINGDQRHIDVPNLLPLFGGKRMAQVSQVDNAESAEIEDEGGSFECPRHTVLVNRHVVNKDLCARGY